MSHGFPMATNTWGRLQNTTTSAVDPPEVPRPQPSQSLQVMHLKGSIFRCENVSFKGGELVREGCVRTCSIYILIIIYV